MKEKRRDSKERILHTGESQRTEGKYLYLSLIHILKVIQSVSSLTAPEHIPKGIIPTVENTENIITTSSGHNKITA